MKDVSIGNAFLTFSREKRPFESGGQHGTAEIVELKTSDGLNAEVSIQQFVNEVIHVRLTEFLSPPPPLYSHLIKNGTLTVQVRHDGKWVALLRALRPGSKDYPTLNHISLDELNGLLGEDCVSWLEGMGFEFGLWVDLNPKAARFKESFAVAIEPEKAHLLVAPWALTRVVALMKRLGKNVVDL